MIIRKVFNRLCQLPGVRKIVPDELRLKSVFLVMVGKKLDLNNPQTFNEKMQWLKLYDRRPEYADMVDKYKVKKYVAEKIGKQYVIPLLGVWDRFDDVDFSKLPDQFVLKCNHDSGNIFICRNKSSFNYKLARKKLEKSLKTNFFYWGREWSYKNVKPKIIAESYLSDGAESGLTDYKLMCFNEKVQFVFVCSDRFSDKGLHITVLDRDWNVLPVRRPNHPTKEMVAKPLNYSKMVEFAEILAKGTTFLRVDFYEVKSQIYFGELTFYPGSGFEKFQPEEWDYKLGKMLKLPDKKI